MAKFKCFTGPNRTIFSRDYEDAKEGECAVFSGGAEISCLAGRRGWHQHVNVDDILAFAKVVLAERGLHVVTSADKAALDECDEVPGCTWAYLHASVPSASLNALCSTMRDRRAQHPPEPEHCRCAVEHGDMSDCPLHPFADPCPDTGLVAVKKEGR